LEKIQSPAKILKKFESKKSLNNDDIPMYLPVSPRKSKKSKKKVNQETRENQDDLSPSHILLGNQNGSGSFIYKLDGVTRNHSQNQLIINSSKPTKNLDEYENIDNIASNLMSHKNLMRIPETNLNIEFETNKILANYSS
jgi:hypothetical protein